MILARNYMYSLMMISDMLSKHVGAVKSVLKWFKINDIQLVHLLVVCYLLNTHPWFIWHGFLRICSKHYKSNVLLAHICPIWLLLYVYMELKELCGLCRRRFILRSNFHKCSRHCSFWRRCGSGIDSASNINNYQ